jgi:hypothetical protein
MVTMGMKINTESSIAIPLKTMKVTHVFHGNRWLSVAMVMWLMFLAIHVNLKSETALRPR